MDNLIPESRMGKPPRRTAKNLQFPPLNSFSLSILLSNSSSLNQHFQPPNFHPCKEQREEEKKHQTNPQKMASVSIAMPLVASQKGPSSPSFSGAFLKPLPLSPSNKAVFVNSKSKARLQVQASLKEKAITGLTAAALTASMVMPDAAEAASGLTPSLNNFLFSIGAGGVVLVAILGAVIGVSNFDPVKRG